MIKSVIFDFDGTLADSSFAISKLNNYFIDKYKINSTGSMDLKRISTLPLKQRFKEMGIPFYRLPLMSLEALKIYSSFIDEIKIIEGIPDILKKLAGLGMDMNILSSNSIRNIRQVLQKNNLNHYFSAIYSASKVLKKDKTIIKLLKKKNLSKDSVVYVGDQLEDINSCKRIKVKVIAVSWGYDPADLLMQGEPDYLCREPADLYKYLIFGGI